MIPQSNKLQCSRSSWVKTAFYTFALLLFGITLQAQSASCQVNAGSLKKTSICLQNGQTILKATHRGDTLAPQRYEMVYLLTHGDQHIVTEIASEAAFVLPDADSLAGTYTIHTLVYEPATLNLGIITLGVTPLSTVNALLAQGGGAICAALDMEGASVEFGECQLPCKASAGRLVAEAFACMPSGGELQLKAKVQSAPVVPAGYSVLYALVNPRGEIFQYITTPSFKTMATGRFSLHTLVYDPTTLDLDQIAEADIVTLASIDTLLIQGGGAICGALDMVGAAFEIVACPTPCQVSAGTLAMNVNPCLSDSSVVINAIRKNNPQVPTGHQVRYLLSTSTDKVIQKIGTEPSFAVSDSGIYTIHTVVYDPVRFQIDSLALGTATIPAVAAALDSLCGDVDVVGAVFDIHNCPPLICSARVGTLVANDSTCLFNGKAKVKASVPIAPLVPFGYQSIYLLTSGDSLVVEQKSASPEFEVTRAGTFFIQTFVVDTAAFKLDSIKIGITSTLELNRLLIQGGGSICGALDKNDVQFDITACKDCPASAGTLTSNTVPCLENGKATLTVYNVTSPVVPAGFKIAYLLTNGNKVIEQVSDSASFVIDSMGLYTIHTLVYDFTSFDLSTLVPGTTTLSNVNSQLIQGGGVLCGALDTKGFSYFVLPCSVSCDVDAGTLRRSSESCLQNSQATIEAAHEEAPLVPEGFEVRYLLSVTDLKVIRQISTTPSFVVTAEGDYTIHTFIYDPLEININDVRLNISSVAEVASWLLPDGDACGAVDQKGVTFEVYKCGESCGVSAGSLANINSNICISNGSATLSAFVLNQPFVLSGFEVKYILAYGTDLVIQQTSDNPVFRVNRTGRYTIHTLVYDPRTFNVNAPISGLTTIYDVHRQLLQGGGTVCGALNTTGTAYQVNTCNGADSGDGDASLLRAYPNPSTQKVNVVLPQIDKVDQITIELIHSNGDLARQWQVEGYTPSMNLDVSDVNPGIYYVRVWYDGKFIQQTSIVRAQ